MKVLICFGCRRVRKLTETGVQRGWNEGAEVWGKGGRGGIPGSCCTRATESRALEGARGGWREERDRIAWSRLVL